MADTDVQEPKPNEPMKRLNYFTGQFLEKKDFLAEQQYHMGMRRLGNRALYFGAGVLEDSGFQVKAKNNANGRPTLVEISPGIAIDPAGRELVLVALQTVDVPNAGGAARVVTVEYATQPTDEQTPGDNDRSDFTRVLETPKISVVPTGSQAAASIVIANLTVANGEVTAIDVTSRQRATGRFAGNLTLGQGSNGKLTTRHIDGKDYRNDDADDLHLNWDNGKNVHVGGGGGKSASLSVSGQVDIQAPDSNIYSLRLWRTDEDGRQHKWALWHMNQAYRKNALEIWEYKTDSAGKDCDGNPNDGAMCNPRVVIAEGGNVGIGTVTPRVRLEVADGAIMPAAGNSDKAGILFPSDPGGGGGDKAWIRYYARAPRPGTNDSTERTALEIGVANDNLANSAYQDDILLMPAGGVGIGTTSPGAKLDVVGGGGSSVDLVVNGRMQSNNNDGGLWIAGDRFVGGHSTNKIGFWSGNEWRLTVQADGNVGIGTPSPSAKLDVNGNLTINNTLSSAGRLHISGNELLYLLNKDGVVIGKEWGGNGNLTVEGNIAWGGDHTSSGYVVLGAMQICWGTVTANVGQYENHVAVGFPSAFLSNPAVTVTLNDPGYGAYDLKGGVGAYSVSTAGFEVLYKTTASRDQNRNLTFYWIAIGAK